jgi:uncharacterized protein (TIGR02246 family)
MMNRSCILLLLPCIAVTNFGVEFAVHAQVDPAPQGEAGAIRAAAKDYLAAMRRGDNATLRKIWTSEGDYVNAAGQSFKARELFRGPATNPSPNMENPDLRIPESSLRFITPDVAIEDGISVQETLPEGNVLTGRFTAVWVKRDGRWLLDSLREAAAAAPLSNENLKPLEWLLGEWVGTRDEDVILVSSHWSDGGSYIVREFLVLGAGGETISATQRIGWDPIARQLKSWSFDSQGGSGQGTWRRDGESWIVESTEVLADGKKSKTSATYVPGEDGQFTSELTSVWDAKGGQTAIVNLPAILVEFKRAVEDE